MHAQILFIQYRWSKSCQPVQFYNYATVTILFSAFPHQMQIDSSQIISALALSLRAQTQEHISQATVMLNSQQHLPNYLPTLLQLAVSLFQQQDDENLAMAALVQVKNFVRSYWRVDCSLTDRIRVGLEDRQAFLSSIWTANLLLCENYRSSKLMKDVISIVGREGQEHLAAAYDLLKEGKELRAVLNYLLGVLASLHNSFDGEDRGQLKMLVQHFLPAIYQLIKEGEQALLQLYDHLTSDHSLSPQERRGQTENYQLQKLYFDEIVYLGVKFAAKALQEKMTRESEEALLELGGVAMARMGLEGEAEEGESDRKGSNSFNFVHAKKWACRYMERFIRNLLMRCKSTHAYRPAAQRFIDTQEPLLLPILLQMLATPQPHKLKMEELRLMQVLIATRAEVFASGEGQHHRQLYLAQHLPLYIRLHPAAVDFLSSSPHEHMQGEEISLRRRAAVVWGMLAFHRQPFEATRLPLQLMVEWSRSSDRLSCEMVSYLLLFCCELMSFEQFREDWQPFINAHLAAVFQLRDWLLVGTALEVMVAYDEWITLPTLEAAKQAILIILLGEERASEGEWVVARLKAALALERVLASRANALSREQAVGLMGALVDAVGVYQSDEIMNTLRRLVEVHGASVEAMAVDLAQLMGGWATNYIASEKELKLNSEFNQKTYYIALGTMDVLTSLCALQIPQTPRAARSPTQRAIAQTVEQQLVAITLSVFSSASFEEHLQRVLMALATFLNHCSRSDPLSPALWFCFHVCLYRVSGLPKAARAAVSGASPAEAAVLRTCFVADSFNLNSYLVAIRGFLDFVQADLPIRNGREIGAELLGANDMEKIYYMVIVFYQKGGREGSEGQVNVSEGRVLSALVLTYLLECHGSELHPSLLLKILNIVIINSKAPYTLHFLVKYNIQLLLTWFWALQDRAWSTLLQHFAGRPDPAHDAEELLAKVLVSHSNYGLRELRSERELKRAVVGLCAMILGSLLESSRTGSRALGFARIHTYINWMFYYVRSSLESEARRLDSDYESEEEPEEEESALQMKTSKEGSYVVGVGEDEDGVEYACGKMQEVEEVTVFLDFLVQLQRITPDGYRTIVSVAHNQQVRNLLVDTDNFTPPYCSLYDYEYGQQEEEEATV